MEERDQVTSNDNAARYAAIFEVGQIKADLRTRAMKGGIVTIASQFGAQAAQLAGTMVLARLLSPSDFGVVAMLAVVTGLGGVLGAFGLAMAAVQAKSFDHAKASTLFWLNFAFSIAIGLVLVVSAPFFAWIYHEPALVPLMPWAALEVVFFGISTQHRGLLQRQMAFGKLNLANIAGLVVGVGVGIGLALAGASVWALVSMPVVRSAVSAMLMWWFCRWVPGRPCWDGQIASMLRFGRNMVGQNLANQLANRADSFIVGISCGAGPLGAYSRAYHLLLLPVSKINEPISRVGIATLSRLTDEPDRYRKAFFQMLNKLMILAAPLIALLVGASDWVVRLVLGAGWELSSELFGFLGLAALMITFQNPQGWLLVSQNRTSEMIRLTTICLFIRLLGLVVGQFWGIKGVAIAVSANAVLLMPLVIWLVCRRGPIRMVHFLPSLGLAAIGAGLTFFSVVLIRSCDFAQNIAVGLPCCLAATGLVSAGLYIRTQGNPYREIMSMRKAAVS